MQGGGEPGYVSALAKGQLLLCLSGPERLNASESVREARETEDKASIADRGAFDTEIRHADVAYDQRVEAVLDADHGAWKIRHGAQRERDESCHIRRALGKRCVVRNPTWRAAAVLRRVVAVLDDRKSAERVVD